MTKLFLNFACWSPSAQVIATAAEWTTMRNNKYNFETLEILNLTFDFHCDWLNMYVVVRI